MATRRRRSPRTRRLRLDNPEHDRQRRIEATALYEAVTQAREQAIRLIDRALLMARIAGTNAYILAASQQRQQQRKRKRSAPRGR